MQARDSSPVSVGLCAVAYRLACANARQLTYRGCHVIPRKSRQMPISTLFAPSSAVDNPVEAGSFGALAPAGTPPAGQAFYRQASVVPARVEPHDPAAGEFASDWNDLFNAVKERLSRTVATPSPDAITAADHGVARISNAVLECVQALDQLQAAVSAELSRREGLEAAVFDAQTSLAQVRCALVGTRRGERRALYLAAHDGLTKLPNRGFLVERINQELTLTDPDRRMFAVMFLDLRGFKRVNDSHGHAVGDELLRIVAARLRRVVRAQDMVSRVGGDEFACLIGRLQDRAQLTHMADKMADAISAPCTIGTLHVTVNASIGIALCPVHGNTADALLANADQAMVAAKRRQSAVAFFSVDGEVAPAAQPDPAPQYRPPPRS